MKTEFSYRSSRGGSSRRRLLVATVLIVLIFFADFLSGGKIRDMVRAAASATWGFGARASLAVWGSGIFATRSALEKENESLREQLAQSEARIAGYRVLEDENRSLRSIVRLAEEEVGITAPIASSLRTSPYSTFVVGAGAADGVGVGSLVITGNSGTSGFVIGRVSDVGAHTALVTQLFAPNASVEATIQGASVVLKGQGGGNARAQVPRSIAITVGDAVTSPLLGGRAIGLVGAMHLDPSSVYSDVYVNFPVNLTALKFVYVVLQN